MPAEPGVYLLRDRAGAAAGKALGKVLYVGKAKSLRSRVRAYFREGGDTRFQVRFLMKRTIPVPTYAIDDQTAIKVTHGTVEVVSEGHWKLFTP